MTVSVEAHRRQSVETYILVHVVPLRINNFGDSNLGNFNGTSQTGAPGTTQRQSVFPSSFLWQSLMQTDLRITVEDCTLSNPLSASFQQCIFLGVKAKAGGKTDTTAVAAIATWACNTLSK